MIRRPPRSTRTDTLFPYTTLFRSFAYDLATCLNAWCFEQDNAFNVTKARMLLQSYSRERPFSQEELAALPLLARGSALRFLLPRLYDWLHHPAGAFVKPTDSLESRKKPVFHQQVHGRGASGQDTSGQASSRGGGVTYDKIHERD